jgi:hypothetical protein
MTKEASLLELAKIIRSKNAKAYELTFDIIFKERETYERVKETGIITEQLISKLYRIPAENVMSVIWFDPGNAIKTTIRRPIVAGDLGETDVYGAQQHAPLLEIKIPLEEY